MENDVMTLASFEMSILVIIIQINSFISHFLNKRFPQFSAPSYSSSSMCCIQIQLSFRIQLKLLSLPSADRKSASSRLLCRHYKGIISRLLWCETRAARKCSINFIFARSSHKNHDATFSGRAGHARACPSRRCAPNRMIKS